MEAEVEMGPIRPLRRSEYDTLVAQGVFDDERIELLYGRLVEMSPQDARHAAVVQRLNRILSRELGDRADLRVQLPLAASDDSEPEPDVAVVPQGDYDDAHPKTALLVIEVAHTSLARDRGPKADLYAGAGVDDYWVVNLVDDLVEVHRDAVGGVYRRITPHRPGDAIRPLGFEDVEVAVEDVLRSASRG